MGVRFDEHRLIVGGFCERQLLVRHPPRRTPYDYYHSTIVLAQVSPPPNTINKT